MARQGDREKFVRLANARVNKTLDAIRLIGNLSNKSNYTYEHADVEKIFRVLNAELKTCRQRFDGPDQRGGVKFSLDGSDGE